MWCTVLPNMGAKMEAKYLERLYVTELMLLTIGLRWGPLFVSLEHVLKCEEWLLLDIDSSIVVCQQ